MDRNDPATRKMIFNILDAIPFLALVDYLQQRKLVDLEDMAELNQKDELIKSFSPGGTE